MYVVQGMTLAEIEGIIGCTRYQLGKLIREYGLSKPLGHGMAGREPANKGKNTRPDKTYHVNQIRGPARKHNCWRCLENGITKRAYDWAHVHGESGLDIWADFIPLCRACHMRYDGHGYRNIGPKPKLSEIARNRKRDHLGHFVGGD
jgi:hypothetical protein